MVEAEANQKAQLANLETAKSDLDKAKALGGDIAAVEAIQKEMIQIRTQIEEAEIETAQLKEPSPPPRSSVTALRKSPPNSPPCASIKKPE